MAISPPSDSSAASGYAPFAQLIKMLLPSARSVALYDALARLIWCSDGFEPMDLRVLLDQQRANDTSANRGNVETTSSGVPVFMQRCAARTRGLSAQSSSSSAAARAALRR